MPAAAAARASATEPSIGPGPPSMPGGTWQCRSIIGVRNSTLRPSGSGHSEYGSGPIQARVRQLHSRAQVSRMTRLAFHVPIPIVGLALVGAPTFGLRSEEHTSELQSPMSLV